MGYTIKAEDNIKFICTNRNYIFLQKPYLDWIKEGCWRNNTDFCDGKAEKIYKKEPSEVNNVLKQISENNRYESYKPNYNNLSSIYKEYAQSPKNPQTVAEFIANGLDMNENEQQKLQNSIKENNLNYIKEITENSTSKGLRTLIIKAVLNNYDKKYNTEYTTKADSVIENYENKKTNEEKLKMLDNFDWNFDSLF